MCKSFLFIFTISFSLFSLAEANGKRFKINQIAEVVNKEADENTFIVKTEIEGKIKELHILPNDNKKVKAFLGQKVILNTSYKAPALGTI
jgi:hypothetical protein